MTKKNGKIYATDDDYPASLCPETVKSSFREHPKTFTLGPRRVTVPVLETSLPHN